MLKLSSTEHYYKIINALRFTSLTITSVRQKGTFSVVKGEYKLGTVK